MPRGDWSNGDHHPRTRTAPQPLLLRRRPPVGLRLRLPRVRRKPRHSRRRAHRSRHPTGDNKIAADFYHSQLWPTVRFWERAFWILNGGERRARDVVLRRLPKSPGLRLLDVAIGDGVYTSWLRQDWSIVGVDVSTTQLAACRRRNCGRNRRVLSHSRYEIIWRGGGYLMVGNAP